MQTQSLLCRVVIAVLGFTTPVVAQQTGNAQPSEELKAVLSRLDKTAASFRSAEANFEWGNYQKVVDAMDKQSGKVYFRRSGGKTEMAADVTEPTPPKYVVLSGGKVELYQPSADHLDIYSTGNNNEAVESFLVLGFGGSGGDMLKSFDVTYGGQEKIDGVDTDRLELNPKSAKVKNMFSHIELWIDSRGISIRQKLITPEGDYRLNKYSDIVLDKKIPESAFKLRTTNKTTMETH